MHNSLFDEFLSVFAKPSLSSNFKDLKGLYYLCHILFIKIFSLRFYQMFEEKSKVKKINNKCEDSLQKTAEWQKHSFPTQLFSGISSTVTLNF